MSKIKVGLIQMKVKDKKDDNLHKAAKLIDKIGKEDVDMVVLPEMFSCPYNTKNFPIYAEEEGDYSYKFLSEVSKRNNIYLIAGSIPEKEDNNIYNTSYVFNRQGEKIAKHRKVHLFYQES